MMSTINMMRPINMMSTIDMTSTVDTTSSILAPSIVDTISILRTMRCIMALSSLLPHAGIVEMTGLNKNTTIIKTIRTIVKARAMLWASLFLSWLLLLVVPHLMPLPILKAPSIWRLDDMEKVWWRWRYNRGRHCRGRGGTAEAEVPWIWKEGQRWSYNGGRIMKELEVQLMLSYSMIELFETRNSVLLAFGVVTLYFLSYHFWLLLWFEHLIACKT